MWECECEYSLVTKVSGLLINGPCGVSQWPSLDPGMKQARGMKVGIGKAEAVTSVPPGCEIV